MAKAVVTLYRCIQDSQEYGSDDEHMISRVFFRVNVEKGKETEDVVDIKQTVGSSFETGPLEVYRPRGKARGPWNHKAFVEAVESYYRGLVGATGQGFRIGPAVQLRMHDNCYTEGINLIVLKVAVLEGFYRFTVAKRYNHLSPEARPARIPVIHACASSKDQNRWDFNHDSYFSIVAHP